MAKTLNRTRYILNSAVTGTFPRKGIKCVRFTDKEGVVRFHPLEKAVLVDGVCEGGDTLYHKRERGINLSTREWTPVPSGGYTRVWQQGADSRRYPVLEGTEWRVIRVGDCYNPSVMAWRYVQA